VAPRLTGVTPTGVHGLAGSAAAHQIGPNRTVFYTFPLRHVPIMLFYNT